MAVDTSKIPEPWKTQVEKVLHAEKVKERAQARYDTEHRTLVEMAMKETGKGSFMAMLDVSDLLMFARIGFLPTLASGNGQEPPP